MAKTSGKGTGGVKLGIKEPQVVPEKVVDHTPPGKPPKRIRMLMSLAAKQSYPEGSVFLVPQEVSVNTARSWIASGAAEEDKSLPDPPETK